MLASIRWVAVVVAWLLLFHVGIARAQDKPPTYGSIESYPAPVGQGAGEEFEYCYRYAKRIWELVRGRDRTMETLNTLTPLIRQMLGSQGASEDIADIEPYFSGRYATKDDMAGARFHR